MPIERPMRAPIYTTSMPARPRIRSDGWGGWIRTIIMGFKVPCPAVRRRPSRARGCMGAVRGSRDPLRCGRPLRMTDGQRARGMAEWRAMGGEGGQAMVEAAFALPLTVVLILGTIQITQLQQARLLVEYAAFNAARAGVVQNGNDGSDGTAGPMHDAAALSLLSGQGPTDGLG